MIIQLTEFKPSETITPSEPIKNISLDINSNSQSNNLDELKLDNTIDLNNIGVVDKPVSINLDGPSKNTSNSSNSSNSSNINLNNSTSELDLNLDSILNDTTPKKKKVIFFLLIM